MSGSYISSLQVTQRVPQPEHLYSLKRNFPFHWLFSDLLLSGLFLEREREFKEREKKKASVH
jgi:hypothetical protein